MASAREGACIGILAAFALVLLSACADRAPALRGDAQLRIDATLSLDEVRQIVRDVSSIESAPIWMLLDEDGTRTELKVVIKGAPPQPSVDVGKVYFLRLEGGRWVVFKTDHWSFPQLRAAAQRSLK